MYRFAAFALFSSIAFGQSDPFAPKPPAEVDAALRARVLEFFDLQVKGTPRKAEVLVAEDSKDLYYSDPKPKFLSCELKQIDYTSHFTKAKVLSLCERNVMIPGAGTLKAKVPTPSTWRMEDGQWFYYLDPETMYPSPFGGPMKPGPMPGNGAAAAPDSQGIPSIESMTKSAMEQIKLDRNEVSLKVGETAEVTISNLASGPMTLLAPANLNGIEAKLDKATVESGGKIVLKLHAGKAAASGAFNLQVEQTGQQLPIQITVSKK